MYENLDSFERLATGLSDSERKSILEQLEKSTQKHEDTEMSPVDVGDDFDYVPFPEQIKHESFFVRLYVWIKSIVSNKGKESVFNEYKLSQLSKKIMKNYPGLIDSKRGLLLAVFYNKLNELNSAAQFFRPYVSEIDEDEGLFYVLLGSVIMPEIDSQLKNDTNPYSNPVTSSARLELRVELLHKMDAIFDSISQLDKAKMYEAAKSAEWLRVFVKLPFTRFLSAFNQNQDDLYDCPYSTLSNEITIFSRSLCNKFVITDELLETVYLFSKRNKTVKSQSDEEETSQFLDKAHAAMTLVHMFMTSVPLKSLGCLISDDIYWKPQPFSGGEDWFVRYKNTCKKIFDKKWESWAKDCQIESLKVSLKSNFGIDEFPQLPDRPWADLWGGQYFRYELTAGFLYWFMVKKFPDYELSLKSVMVEGDFVNKENQTAFTDAFNVLIQLSVSFQNLQMKCSPSGETGMMLKKLGEDHLRTLNAQTKAEQLIRSVESDFETLLHRFGDASRSMEQLLVGILGFSKDSRFDSISNLNTLQGKDNKSFQDDLKKAHTALDTALNLIKELEVLDNRKTRI